MLQFTELFLCSLSLLCVSLLYAPLSTGRHDEPLGPPLDL